MWARGAIDLFHNYVTILRALLQLAKETMCMCVRYGFQQCLSVVLLSTAPIVSSRTHVTFHCFPEDVRRRELWIKPFHEGAKDTSLPL